MDPRASLERFIRWVTCETTFHKHYAATVEFDHGNGTFDLRPDDDEMRGLGLQRVAARVGVAGATVTARPGTRCLLAFHDADPRKPHIAAWEFAQGSAVVSFDGGQAAVARYGGAVTVLTEPALAVTGVAGGTIHNPNPSPPPPTIDVPLPIGTPFAGVVTIAIPGSIFGVIQQGAQKVWA